MIEQMGKVVTPVLESSLNDLLGFGGKVTLLGVCIVFLALVALIFITWLYPVIIKALMNGKGKDAKKVIAQPEVAISANASKDNMADDELIAVITAAIAASLGTSSNGIVIKSLKRSTTQLSSWGRESRNEQIYNRF